MSQVAIAASALRGFSDGSDAAVGEVVSDLAREALNDADLIRDDLDAIVMTDQDAFDGAAISGGMKVTPAGGYEKPAMRVQNNGGYGIHQAIAKMHAGKADCILLVAADTVEVDARVVSHISQEPLYTRPFGQSNVHSYGHLATHLLEQDIISEEDLATVAAKNYESAAANPWAHRTTSYSTDEVLDSRRVVGPLRHLMLGPHSMGAAVLILVSGELAADFDDAVQITGAGIGSEQYHFRDVDALVRQEGQRAARREAYEEAGIEKPLTDIDYAEINAPAPMFELLGYDSLGFADERNPTDLLADGTTAAGGALPVNLTGGTIATNPPSTGGLYRTIMTAKILSGEFSGRGVPDAKRAVVADSDLHLGVQGRTDAVLVLEGGGAQ